MLLQSLMVEADGRIVEVSRNSYGPARGYLLRTEIRQFQAAYPARAEGPPEIAVVLELQLSTGSSDRMVGHTLVSARVPAFQNKLDAIVMAFDAATGKALAQGVAWTLRLISEDDHHKIRPWAR